MLFHDKLTLPGLGTFEIHREAAIIKGRKITPPKSFIVFHPDEFAIDNTLAMKIADTEEIKYGEAEKLVQDFSKKVQRILKKNGIVNIKRLGTLERDQYNNYIFYADDKIKLDFEINGFETFELDEHEEVIKEQTATVPESSRHTEILENDDVSYKSNIVEEIKAAAEENKKEEEVVVPKRPFPVEFDLIEEKKSNRNFIRLLNGSVVIILIAIVIIALSTDFFDNLNFHSLKNLFRSEKASTTSFISDDQEDYEKTMELALDSLTRLENALRIEEDEPAAKPAEVPAYSEYHIIAGSFSQMQNADELQKKLNLQGYSSIIINRGDGFFRVSAAVYRNKEEALENLEKFKQNTIYKSAWLLGLKEVI